MNRIQISNNEIFEFKNKELVAEVHDQILNSKINYQPNAPAGENAANYSCNGYIDLGSKNLAIFYNKNLYNWLNSCIKEVSDIYFPRGRLQICDLWVVKTTFGQISPLHHHKISVFSGIYYITEQTSSETIFHFEDPVYKYFEPYYGRGIRPRKYMYKSSPESGKLLIWPSYLSHSVNIHKEKNTRYSIAFNTMITGTVGEVRTGYCDLNVVPPDNNLNIIKYKEK